MRNEIGNFKNKLFGGFDRHDVVNYIEEIAAARNQYRQEAETLREQVEELTARVETAESAEERARADAADADHRAEEIRITAVQDAAAALADLEEKYREIRMDMEVTAAHVRCELTRIGESIQGLLQAFTTTEEKISALRASLRVQLPAEAVEGEEHQQWRNEE